MPEEEEEDKTSTKTTTTTREWLIRMPLWWWMVESEYKVGRLLLCEQGYIMYYWTKHIDEQITKNDILGGGDGSAAGRVSTEKEK